MVTTPSVCPSAVELRLDRIATEADVITVYAVGRRRRVPCPLCGTPAARPHSRYTRTLADLPWRGAQVRLLATVRRFFCDAVSCARRIFGERLPLTAARYARRTHRAASALELIGFALGGRAAARLAAALGLPAGPGVVLRCVAAPAVPERPTPRVLGVDDWAWRKGQTYGTILVDLERRQVVDLLPGRAASALAAWLRAHPGVEIVSRDRGGEYAEAVRTAAPDAGQVADRFHLLRNLVDAVERVIVRHGPPRREPPTRASGAAPSVPNGEDERARRLALRALTRRRPYSATPTDRPGPTAREQESARRRAARLARYERVVALAASRLVGLDRCGRAGPVRVGGHLAEGDARAVQHRERAVDARDIVAAIAELYVLRVLHEAPLQPRAALEPERE